MKPFLLILAALCLWQVSCSSPVPRKVKQLAVPVPGGGAKLMAVRVPEPREPGFKASAIVGIRTFVWHFDTPQGTTVSNFWWDLKRSTNLTDWTLVMTNVVFPIDVLTTNEMEFFRLVGRL